MAKTPAKTRRQGAERKRNDIISEKRRQAYVAALASGMSAEEIACKLDPSKGRKYRRIRGQVWRVVAEDEEYHQIKASMAQGAMISGLDAAAQALVKRAERGRPDAIKLLFEATGFHNPKVKHEHSGDIQIHLNMPRPEPVVNETAGELEDGQVVDAEVVDE